MVHTNQNKKKGHYGAQNEMKQHVDFRIHII